MYPFRRFTARRSSQSWRSRAGSVRFYVWWRPSCTITRVPNCPSGKLPAGPEVLVTACGPRRSWLYLDRSSNATRKRCQTRGEIDFHDMISKATEHVEAGWYRSRFGYILVRVPGHLARTGEAAQGAVGPVAGRPAVCGRRRLAGDIPLRRLGHCDHARVRGALRRYQADGP